MATKLKTSVATSKSRAAILRNLKELRTLIDSSGDDPVTQRIAQGMEYALRWAVEKTVDWPCMEREARLLASILRLDLAE